jgi:hypothetical protein
MIPLPVNPTVAVLILNGKVQAVASNIDPNINVVVVNSLEAYGEIICNLPFDSANPNPQTQVLAAKH